MHCTHPDHDHASAVMLGRVEHACAERGLRLTELRRRVFELIADSTRPVKAYDLMEKVRKQGAGPTAPPTVYRALDFLLEQGLIHWLASRNVFIGCRQPDRHHSEQFLICQDCGLVDELNTPAVEELLRAEAVARQFEMRAQRVEVLGRCLRCQQGVARHGG